MKPEEQELFLLSLLKEREQITREEVMEQLHIKRRTLFHILDRLRNQGHIVKQSHGKLHLVSQAETYPAISKDIIRYWWILKILQEHGKAMTADELIQAYPSDMGAPLWCEDSLRSVLKNMCEHSLLKQGKNAYQLFQAPLQLRLSDGDAERLLTGMRDFKKGTSYSDVLDNVYEKILDACPDIAISDDTAPYYAQSRASAFSDTKLKAFRHFCNFPYDRYVLNITYCTRGGKKQHLMFQTGLFVYSEDKDRFYILGESDNTVKILDIEQIEDISATNMEHNLFHSKVYQNMAKEMFGISIDKLVHVKVQFDYAFNIREKLERLCETRPSASLTEISDRYLLFEDDIRGLPDFANYLRRFGRSATVIEPIELQELMSASVKRTLERYHSLKEENANV